MIVKIHLVERGGALCGGGRMGLLNFKCGGGNVSRRRVLFLFVASHFALAVLSGILGMDVHNRVMCLLVWPVQEVERKVGWLRELWVAPNGFFSFSFLSSERRSEQTLKLAKVGAAPSSS